MPPRPVYISASRRTDIPRFFTDDFFAAWQKGEISYDGGYGRSYTVSLRPEDVLGYIFLVKGFYSINQSSVMCKTYQSEQCRFFTLPLTIALNLSRAWPR